jgi:hypothetical protein
LQSQDQGVESNLDFMAAMPLVYPQKTILFQAEDEYYEILQHDPARANQYPGFWNSELLALSISRIFWVLFMLESYS